MEDEYAPEVYKNWPIFRDNGITDMYAAFELLGMDVLLNFWGYVIPSPTFMMPWFQTEIIGETENTVIIRGEYGSLEEKFKDGRKGGRMFQPAVVTPDDWKRIKNERFIIDDPRRNIDINRIKQALRGKEHLPLGLFAGSFIGFTRLMLTFEGAVYACYDYPDMIEDMAETNCRLIERYLDQLLPNFRFDAVSFYENITCKNGPTIPVWVVREIVAPRIKRVCKKLDAYGVDIISVGSDGNIRPILPILLDCGINCLSPYEVNGCVHPGVLLDEYPGSIHIIGGVDKLIFHRGKEAIDQYLTSLLPYVKRGGFIPHVDHTVYPEIGQENYLYYLKRKRELFA